MLLSIQFFKPVGGLKREWSKGFHNIHNYFYLPI